MTCKILVLRMQ